MLDSTGPGGQTKARRAGVDERLVRMDSYTQETQSWLDKRFQQTDEDGVYFAHQPIYGFRKGHSEFGMVNRYAITYHTACALAHLRAESFLDVGGAEGYKAALMRALFGWRVTSVDLSEAACRRARELFGVEGRSVDIHALPYEEDAFDVVLCSETLEHVADIQGAARELFRVAAKALVITVPHEPEDVVQENIRQKIPHAHIHSLNTGSFDFLAPQAAAIHVRRYHHPRMMFVNNLAEGMKKPSVGRSGRMATRLYNALSPFVAALVGRRAVAGLIHLDAWLTARFAPYGGMVFTILKDADAYRAQPLRPVQVRDILDFGVPLHYPR